MRLREIKNIFHKELSDLYPQEEIDSFFYLCIEHYLGLERFVLALQPGLTVYREEEEQLFNAIDRLKKEEPIQYILGETQFAGLRFKVNSSVLIPRPETEELVQWIMDDYNTNKDELNILDIGTGSGCIAVSLASQLGSSHVYGIDISEDALLTARENAEINGVEVCFRQMDICKRELWDINFDIIVSNPPYVRHTEKHKMKTNVVGFEPEVALFVTDEDPLIYYRHISRLAKANLKSDGSLYLELNQYLSNETVRLFEEQNFSEIELKKDMFGNDRMLRVKGLQAA